MKKLLALFVSAFFALGFVPSNSDNEYKLIFSAPYGSNDFEGFVESLKIEGQIHSKKVVNGVTIGSLYSFSQDNNKIGGHVTYAVNSFVDISAQGYAGTQKSFGSSFSVHFNISDRHGGKLRPYVHVSDEKFGGGGLVWDTSFSGVKFDLGLGIEAKDVHEGFDLEKSSLQLIIGTTLDNLDLLSDKGAKK